MPAEARRCNSSTSSSSRSPNSLRCRTGATMKCPEVYGNLFNRAIARAPRATTSLSASSPSAAAQKRQPESSSADLMYSRRQGAHSCFTRRVYSDELVALHRHGSLFHRGARRGEPYQRGDHARNEQQGGGEEDRAEHPVRPPVRLPGPKSFTPRPRQPLWRKRHTFGAIDDSISSASANSRGLTPAFRDSGGRART